MPGFSQRQLNYSAKNANTVVVLIGDVEIAFAQAVDHTFDFGTDGLYGVGSAKPQEIQQLRVSPQITINQLALTEQGVARLTGGVTLMQLLANNSFNFFVVNGASNSTYVTYVGGVCSNFSESIPSNQPISDSYSFLCLDALDVNGQSLLDGPNAYNVPNSQGSPVNGGLGVNVNGAVTVGGLSVSV